MSRLDEILEEVQHLLAEAALEIGDSSVGSFRPRLDVLESETYLEIRAEVPGVPADDLLLSIAADRLVLAGTKPNDPPARDHRPHHHRLERGHGRFERTIPLPGPLDPSTAKASLEDGLLTIRIPRLQERRLSMHEIEIRQPEEPGD